MYLCLCFALKIVTLLQKCVFANNKSTFLGIWVIFIYTIILKSIKRDWILYNKTKAMDLKKFNLDHEFRVFLL